VRLAGSERAVEELGLRPASGDGVADHAQRFVEVAPASVGDNVSAEVGAAGGADHEVRLPDGDGNVDEVAQQSHDRSPGKGRCPP